MSGSQKLLKTARYADARQAAVWRPIDMRTSHFAVVEELSGGDRLEQRPLLLRAEQGPLTRTRTTSNDAQAGISAKPTTQIETGRQQVESGKGVEALKPQQVLTYGKHERVEEDVVLAHELHQLNVLQNAQRTEAQSQDRSRSQR
jgi:hypothetical protein